MGSGAGRVGPEGWGRGVGVVGVCGSFGKIQLRPIFKYYFTVLGRLSDLPVRGSDLVVRAPLARIDSW